MRLLLDQNLSWRLVGLWADIFPGTAHVRDLGMTTADDREIWDLARERGFALVTKDSDFDDARAYPGPPPRLIRLATGNMSTAGIDRFVRARLPSILAFGEGDDRALVLG